MFKYYLTSAYRNILKSKVNSAIIIIAIVLGITAFLFIFQYIRFELTYDSFNKNAKDIYRINVNHYVNKALINKIAYTRFGMGEALKSNCPEVINYARAAALPEAIVTFENSSFHEFTYSVESSFLTIFSFNFIKGDPQKALSEPNSVVISETASKKYFHDKDPIGKILKLDESGAPTMYYNVKGVFKDLHRNSHLKFNMLFSFERISNHPYFKHNPWSNDFFITYLLLKPKTNIKLFEKKMNDLYIENAAEADKKKNAFANYYLQPLRSIYLHSNDLYLEPSERGNYSFLFYLFTLTALIFFMAIINYFSITSLKLIARQKEFSINKINGAKSKNIILHCVVESIIFSVTSFAIVIFISALIFPWFNRYYALPSTNNILHDYSFWQFLGILFFVFISVTGIILGIRHSKYKTLISESYQIQKRGLTKQKIILCVQLVLSIICIFGALTIKRQVDFMTSQGIGMNIEQVMSIKMPLVSSSNDLKKNVDVFIEDIQKNAFIESATNTNLIPGYPYTSTIYIRRSENENQSQIGLSRFWTDQFFLKTYQIKLLSGRFFADNIKNEDYIVLNERASKMLKFDNYEKAIGSELIVGDNTKMKILGIVSDFQNLNLRKPIEPVCIYYLDKYHTYDGFISIKYNNIGYQDLVKFVDKKWKYYFPGNPFDHYLGDEYYNHQFKSYVQFKKTFFGYSILLLIIVCLGIGVLSSSIAKKREKEIAIHKIHGALFLDSVIILIKDFGYQIIVALAIGLPLAYYLFNNWLMSFSYRVDINVWTFIISSITITIVILLVIIFQIVKVSRINPANTLRSE